MMTESQRIDYLIRVLSGNNAKNFAEKAGIRPDSLSRARKGINSPSSYFERILAAFPSVSREWLYSGEGEPLADAAERNEILAKLDSLEKEVKRLSEMMERIADSSILSSIGGVGNSQNNVEDTKHSKNKMR